MSTTALVPSLIDDAEFLAQLDALDNRDPPASREDHAGDTRPEPRPKSHESPRERSRPFWEERMREGSAAFVEPDDPEPAAQATGLSRAAALLGLMLCTAAGAGAAALVFHERLALLLR
jgi:hypothetical protein